MSLYYVPNDKQGIFLIFFFSLIPYIDPEDRCYNLHFLQLRYLRLRDTKYLAQNHIARK